MRVTCLYMVAGYLCKLTRILHIILKKENFKKITIISISTIHVHEEEYKAIIYMCKSGLISLLPADRRISDKYSIKIRTQT